MTARGKAVDRLVERAPLIGGVKQVWPAAAAGGGVLCFWNWVVFGKREIFRAAACAATAVRSARAARMRFVPQCNTAIPALAARAVAGHGGSSGAMLSIALQHLLLNSLESLLLQSALNLSESSSVKL
jgi:hypothetical protein